MGLWVRVRGLALAGLVLGGVVVGLSTASLVTANSAVAQTATSIVVEGNRRVESDTIRSYFSVAPGERLDPIKVDAGVKALFATGLFQDVRPTFAGNRLIITVVENSVISRIQFEGNKRVKDEQLLGEIQSKPRGALSRPTVQADVQRIVEIYRRNGRYDIRVEPKIIDRPNNRVDLVFEINEGGKTTVKELVFQGNRAYSSWRLRDVIKTGQSNLLSFLKNNDLYDPDRIESDRELLRRFYLKNGYADVRIVSAVAEFEPSRNGFILTFTIEEGDRYTFGAVDIQSGVRDVDPALLRSKLRFSAGGIYNAELIEKSTEEMTIEMSKRGYAFAQVRPRGDRNFQTHQINIVFVVEEGARAYIERINVRGNSRTRDYVIRREFDIAEGDAYNRVLVDRAERRLKNLNFFKSVKITNEPGSASDRVILNVDVEEQSTGEFSIAGGYSTADGIVAELSVGERNLLGRGQTARASVTYGQRTRGVEVSFGEPYFLDYKLAFGIDLFAKQIDASSSYVYRQETIGGGFRFGIPLREDLAIQLRYSAYRQTIDLDQVLRNCNNVNPNFGLDPLSPRTYPTSAAFGTTPATTPPAGYTGLTNCFADGEASAATKQLVDSGPAIVSLAGYSLIYNTVDNNRNPTRGVLAEVRQDFAGLGGDVNFIRTIGDARMYYEIMSDIVSVLHLQAGHVTGWGGKDLRMLDHFQMGPNLVRGFQTAGIGPRDLTPGTSGDALGGTMYWGASVEAQFPIFGVPKDFGVKVALFADAGSVWDYRGPRVFPSTGTSVTTIDPFTGKDTDAMTVRSSVGAGLIWDSPFGPIRIDYAWPLTKDPNDRVQQLRFSGGTKF
ncbi:MAG: outer membrane protein insertion porin family [Hyphomicrobiales bacterium]|jgi:outer membrane protein insertion porin family|nr:outer membrane protein insertion porin family [Hyphomicrobiales bacterium]